ncbi:MAG: 2-oxoacid:acceptor oxidoreductase family protein [Endomicrobia bacterium]|nr:2-oxoacid:acceptor oxidoreductase family protein [Endomicrobiia bacterium]
MKEIIVFARAGQGAITTAQIIGTSLIKNNLYAYAFPHFGAARMGAPMNAFLRYDVSPIRVRTRIKMADYAIVVDGTLFESQKVFSTLKNSALCIINSLENYEINNVSTINIPANKISQDITGKVFANSVLVGAFAALNSDLRLDYVYEAIKERFRGKLQELNMKLVEAGYNYVMTSKKS